MLAETEAPKVDLSLTGGGKLAAQTSGALGVLAEHLEFGDIIATSGGALIGLCLVDAQHKAIQDTGRQSGITYRQSVQHHFKDNAFRIWHLACSSAEFAGSLNGYANVFPLLSHWVGFTTWEAGTKLAFMFGNSLNMFPAYVRAALPTIDESLADPRVSRFVSNATHLFTGQQSVTESRTVDGEISRNALETYVRTCILPPYFPAMDGVWIDGVFSGNADMYDALPSGENARPLLRIDLGAPKFEAYREAYDYNPHLRARAAEAFAAIGKPLPSDRKVIELDYSDDNLNRSCADLPCRDSIKALEDRGAWRAKKIWRERLCTELSDSVPVAVPERSAAARIKSEPALVAA